MPETANSNRPVALVAGGAGFIGASLCEALLSADIEVVCIDNLSSGKLENVFSLQKNPIFRFIQTDINKPLSDALKTTKFSYVFHLAGVSRGDSGNLGSMLSNSIGTHQLLEIARESKSRFVLVSSAESNESLSIHKSLGRSFGENTGSTSSTLQSSEFSERLVREYAHKFDLYTRIARLIDVYGPRMDLESKEPLNSILAQAFEGERIVLTNDGLSLLHPTYIQDVVFGLLKIASSNSVAADTVYLVGNEQITQRRFAETLIDKLKKDIEITYQSSQHSLELPYDHFGLKEGTSQVGWQPKIGIETGLDKTLEFFNRSASVEDISKPSYLTPVQEQPVYMNSGWSRGRIDPTPDKSNLVKKNTKTGVVLSKKISKIWDKERTQTKSLLRSPRLKVGVVSVALATVVLTLVSPLLSLVVNSSLAFSALKGSYTSLAKYDTSASTKSADQSIVNLKRLRSNIAFNKWFLTLTYQKDAAQNLEDLIALGMNLANGIKQSSIALESVKKIYANNKVDLSHKLNDKQSQEVLKRGETSLELAKKEFVLAKLNSKLLSNLSSSLLLPVSVSDLRQITQYNENVEQLASFYPLLNDFLGITEGKEYLLVFVDNKYFSDFGGRVEESALLKVKNGEFKLLFPSTGVLKPNLSLAGSPKNLTTTLGQIFEKELGVKIDGVYVLDNSSKQRLSNLLKIKQTSSPREFLTSLVNQDFNSAATLLTYFPGLVSEKHILAGASSVLFKSSDERVLGLESSLVEEGDDYIYITRTNLGNTADPDLSFDYRFYVSNQGNISSQLDLSFAKPAGEYKANVKVFLPKNTQLEKALMGTQKLAFEHKSVDGLEMFSFDVSFSGSKTLNLFLASPFKISTIKDTSYTLVVPKQPGTQTVHGRVSINLPVSLSTYATSNFDEITSSGDSSTYDVKVDSIKDYIFHADFQPSGGQ